MKEYLKEQIKDADDRLLQLKETADDLQDKLAIVVQHATEQLSRKNTLVATLEHLLKAN